MGGNRRNFVIIHSSSFASLLHCRLFDEKGANSRIIFVHVCDLSESWD